MSGSMMTSVRIRKDIAELQRQRFSSRQALTAIDFPEGDHNLQKIRVTVRMTGGIYERGTFTFIMDIPPSYPFQAPVVTCITRVWHPNIDLCTGKVLLPILDKDWRPVLSINAVVFGLQLLFLEPNSEYAANAAAADMYSRDHEFFKSHVRETLDGGIFFGLEFPCHPRQQQQHHQQESQMMSHNSHHQQQQQVVPRYHPPAPSVQSNNNSLKRKCDGTRWLADGSVMSSECSPPHSGLEAMCIQDPLEEGGPGGGMRGVAAGPGGREFGMDARSTAQQEEEEEQQRHEGGGGGGGGGGRRRSLGGSVAMDEAGHGDDRLGSGSSSRKRPCRLGTIEDCNNPTCFCDNLQAMQQQQHHHQQQSGNSSNSSSQGTFNQAAAFMPFTSQQHHHRLQAIMMPAAASHGRL